MSLRENHVPVPRLTNKEYLARHKVLRTFWIKYQDLYAVVSVPLQWDIHRFYQPAKDMTDPELTQHRATVTAEEPSLPNRASKAAQRLFNVFHQAKAVAGTDSEKLVRFIRSAGQASTAPAKVGSGVRVTTVATPEPDYDRLASALMALAELLPATELKKLEEEGRKIRAKLRRDASKE
jgi:hypothetical protein